MANSSGASRLCMTSNCLRSYPSVPAWLQYSLQYARSDGPAAL